MFVQRVGASSLGLTRIGLGIKEKIRNWVATGPQWWSFSRYSVLAMYLRSANTLKTVTKQFSRGRVISVRLFVELIAGNWQIPARSKAGE